MIWYKYILTFFVLSSISLLQDAYSQVVINEVCLNNSSTISDFEHEYEDWIELYNSGSETVSLLNYSLSDNPAQATKWTFPAVTIPAGGYLIIWASDKNLKKVDTLHTNFKISAFETLVLSNVDKTVIDIKAIPDTKLDHSYGRTGDGNATWAFLSTASPAAANLANNSFSNYNRDTVHFSLTAGFYSGPQTLELTGGAEIRYTTDGSEPDVNSTLYSNPIEITQTTSIKASIFDNGSKPFRAWVASYLINEATKLPVFALSMNPDDLFDEQRGIYVLGPNAETESPHFGANFWQDWERPVYVEFFNKQKLNVVSQLAGVRIYGNYSRANPQKSLLLMAKSKYGKDHINFKFYDTKNIDSFEDVVLRNSGSDFNVSHFRDGFLQTTIGRFTGLDYQAYQPSVVFLNGAYWGIQNIREKISEDFIAENHAISKDEVDLVETWGDAIAGKNNIWDLEWRARNLNMANQNIFRQVADSFDVDNLIDYMASEVYVGNWDWIGNNIKYWRSKKERKYKMILWDLDISLGLYDLSKVYDNNLDSIYNYKRSVLSPTVSIFKNFTRNIAFRNKFINRYADLMNSLFVPEKFKAKTYEFRDSIASEMPRHHDKWKPYDKWENHIKRMTDYIEARPANARAHLQSQFNLTKQVNLTLAVEPQGAGYIKINSIFTDANPWTGIYYEGVPVQITAIPNPGFTFDHWLSPTLISQPLTSRSTTLNLNTDERITAYFTGTAQTLKLTLSEINFYSDPLNDAGDWIELHNYGTSNLDISFWSIKDRNDYHKFIFPINSILLPDQRIILCSDSLKFKKVFGNTLKISGQLAFAFNNQGDEVRIYDARNELYQRTAYDYYSIWDVKSYGQGYTLELKDSQSDPSMASSWASGCFLGSPTASFTSTCTIGISDTDVYKEAFTIVPNPNEGIFVLHQEKEEVISSLYCYNDQGVLLKIFNELELSSPLNLSSYPTGIYHLRAITKSGKTMHQQWIKY